MNRGLLLLSLLAAAPSAAGADSFNVTIEKPGAENSTATFSSSGVESFDSRPVGNSQTFTTDFGTSGAISGTYTGVDIRGADQFGGAGGNTNFASTSTTAGYSLALSTSNPAGINYFGFYLSALDAGNQLAFYKGATSVFTFDPTNVLALVNGNSAYFGNPDSPFKGQDSGQPFAFLNFYDLSGTFDRVVFTENLAAAGYESDNHTVGFFTSQSGTPVPGVPEPASWAMLIGGLGAIGTALRRRHRPGLAQGIA